VEDTINEHRNLVGKLLENCQLQEREIDGRIILKWIFRASRK
jgi:hypothetical protein